jgi:hypothetical protein
MGLRLAEPEVRALLTTGELRVLGLLPRASNFTLLAEVRGPAGAVHAVYKPGRGETPLWDFPDGTLCRREVAAAILARALGWPRVPPTVLRQGPHGEGAVQLFVEHDPAATAFSLRETHPDALRAVAAFDVVAGNGDRKAGHCLLGPDGTVWAIDHGLCFHPRPRLRTVIWNFAGEPVPEPLLDDLRRVEEALRGDGLRADLAGLLDGEEIDAAADRAGALVAGGTFPEPGAGRSVPWPAV